MRCRGSSTRTRSWRACRICGRGASSGTAHTEKGATGDPHPPTKGCPMKRMLVAGSIAALALLGSPGAAQAAPSDASCFGQVHKRINTGDLGTCSCSTTWASWCPRSADRPRTRPPRASAAADQSHAARRPGPWAVRRVACSYGDRSIVVTTLVTDGRFGVLENPNRQGGSTGASRPRSVPRHSPAISVTATHRRRAVPLPPVVAGRPPCPDAAHHHPGHRIDEEHQAGAVATRAGTRPSSVARGVRPPTTSRSDSEGVTTCHPSTVSDPRPAR